MVEIIRKSGDQRKFLFNVIINDLKDDIISDSLA